MSHSNQLSRSIASMGKILLLTTGIFICHSVLSYHGLYAADDKEIVQIVGEEEKPPQEKEKDWKKELEKLINEISQKTYASIYMDPGSVRPSLKEAVGYATQIKKFLHADLPSMHISPKKKPSDEDLETITEAIYKSAQVLFLDALSKGDESKILSVLGAIKDNSPNKGYFEKDFQDDKDAGSFRNHHLIIDALYAKAFDDIATAWLKPEEAAKFKFENFFPADWAPLEAVKNKIQRCIEKMNEVKSHRQFIKSIDTIHLPKITQESISLIIPSIIWDISNNMISQEKKIKSKDKLPQHNNKDIKAFAHDIVDLLKDTRNYTLNEANINKITDKNLGSLIKEAMSSVDGNPKWSTPKVGGLFGEYDLVKGYNEKGGVAWTAAFAVELLKWASMCHHFQDMKKAEG